MDKKLSDILQQIHQQAAEPCWFCKGSRAGGAYSDKTVKMYSGVRRGDTRNFVVAKTRSVQFNACEIHVPRCQACKKRSLLTNFLFFLVFLCCLGAAYAGVSNAYDLSGIIVYLLSAVTGVILFMIVLAILTASGLAASPLDTKPFEGYPPIAERMKDGWKIGDRPPRGN